MIARFNQQNKDEEKRLFDKLPKWNNAIMQWKHIPQFLEQEIPQLFKPLAKIIIEYFGGCRVQESGITRRVQMEYATICNYCYNPGNQIIVFRGIEAITDHAYYRHLCNRCCPYGSNLREDAYNYVLWNMSNCDNQLILGMNIHILHWVDGQ